MRKLIVAIDGPAGAGKSTVAKRLAKELGYIYMDTGAMYRAFAWKVLQDGGDIAEETKLKSILKSTRIELVDRDGQIGVFVDGLNVTDPIRSPEISQMASKISTIRIVRERMVDLQRDMGLQGGVVAEGRDIGTVVFPKAEVKIYLDAASQERGRRRFAELKGQRRQITLEETLEEMGQRDRRDKERELAPLRPAADAVVIDSTHAAVDEVVERIMQEVKNKMSVFH